jgi:hypothetical protein
MTEKGKEERQDERKVSMNPFLTMPGEMMPV